MPQQELINFRKKYPQYSDVSDKELVEKLSQKYPNAYGYLAENNELNLQPTTVKDSVRLESTVAESTKRKDEPEEIRSANRLSEFLGKAGEILDRANISPKVEQGLNQLQSAGIPSRVAPNTQVPISSKTIPGVINLLVGGAETALSPVSKIFELGTASLNEFQRGVEDVLGLTDGVKVGDLINKGFELAAESPQAGAQLLDEGFKKAGVSEKTLNLGMDRETARPFTEAIGGASSLLTQLILAKGFEAGVAKLKPKVAEFKPVVNESRARVEETKTQQVGDKFEQRGVTKKEFEQRTKESGRLEGDIASGGESLTLLKKQRNERVEKKTEQIVGKYLDENVSPEMINSGTFPKGVVKRISESTLINEKINALEQGAKLGARDKADALAEIQGKVIDYARDNLPKSDLRKSEVTPIMTKIKNAKDVKSLKNAYEKINEVVQKVEKRQLIGDINKTVKKIKPSKTTGGKPMPKVDADTQTTVNKIRSFSNKKNQEKVDRYLEEIASKEEFDLTPENIQDIHLMKTFGDLKGKSNIELANAKAELDYLVKTGRTKFQEKLEARKAKDELLRVETIKVLQGKKSRFDIEEITSEQVKAERGSLSVGERVKEIVTGVRKYAKGTEERILSRLDTQLQGWETALDKLSRRDKGSDVSFLQDYFGRKVHESYVTTQKLHRVDYEMIKSATENITGLKGRRLDKTLAEMGRTKNTGIKIKQGGEARDLYLSQGEAGYIYQLAKDPSNLSELARAGYNKRVLSEIEGWLTSNTKKMADWWMNNYAEMKYKEVNPIHRDIIGIDIPKRKNYAPLARETTTKGLETNLEAGQNFYSSIYKHNFKERVANSNPIKIQDMNNVWLGYMQSMNHFAGWAGTVRELRSVFGNQNVASNIKFLHGAKQYNTLNRFMNDFARGGIDKILTSRGLDKLRGRMTKAKLGLNLPVFFKQQASIPAYLFNLSTKDFAKGMLDFHKNPKKAIQTLSQSEYLKARYGQGWDIDIIQSMRRDTHKKLAGVDNKTDKLMFPTRLGDRMPILAGGWSVYRSKYSEYIKKGYGKERAHERAMTDFERATDLTQQSGTLQSLSEIQRMGSVARMFTMFMTSQNQYYRQMSSALRNLRAGRGSKAKNIKKLVIGHVVLPAAFQFISDGFRFDENRQIRAVATGGVNGIFLVADNVEAIVASLQGEYAGDPGVHTLLGDVFTKSANAIRGMSRGEIEKVVDELAGLGSDVTGVPYDPVKRMVVGFIDEMANGDDLWNGIRKSIGFSDYALDKDDKKSTIKYKQLNNNFDLNLDFDLNLK